MTLTERLALRTGLGEAAANDDSMEIFLSWVDELGLSLYPAQESAMLALWEGHHVLLTTPTGSGKSMVAAALHLRAMARGERSVYTAPIKALVSEKFRALCDQFGAEQVGLMTGDGTVNRDAPILCCTAEVLAKLALRYGEETPYRAVIMDEFHYYGDRERGMAWQLPLLTMPHAQFLLLSGTLGDTRAIEEDLKARTGREVTRVERAERPVPLRFEYSEVPVDQAVDALVRGGKSPVYAVHFTQSEAAEMAGALMSVPMAAHAMKEQIKTAIHGFRFDTPFGATLRRFVMHGVGLHHAGLLPKYRMLVEQLAQRGSFAVICGTDTLGVGINLPIRSVLFTKLCKYAGEQVAVLTVRDFLQIAGRAGRKGYDTEGTVVVQAPDWVIENAKLSRDIADGKKKRGKVSMRKPPTHGYRHWDRETFERLVHGQPETLEGRFSVDHSFMLQLLQKSAETLGDPVAEARDLIARSHTGQRAKARLLEEADRRLAELIEAGVVEDHGESEIPRYSITGGVQYDFSLNHSLSLFLLHAAAKLEPSSPNYALDLLTLVESILEHPRVLLQAQVNREKGAKNAALKAAGVPYEERVELLEQVTYPKPNAEAIYALYNAYAAVNPWLASEPIRPKSIVREMVEIQSTFSNWIKSLELERAEGVLLRYLSQVYQTLTKNIPEVMRTPEVEDITGFLGAMIARVDDSLLKSWESMLEEIAPQEITKAVDISADFPAFRARLRHEMYALVRALSESDWVEAVAATWQGEGSFSADDIELSLTPYLVERGPVRFDPRLKLGWTTRFDQLEPYLWRVTQVLVDDQTDAEEDDAGLPWSIEALVDLREDRNPSGPLLRLARIGE